MRNKIKILLSSEETSHFYNSRVNLWCEKLIQRLTEFNFTVYNIIVNPYLEQNVDLPEDTALIRVPFIGNDELFEKCCNSTDNRNNTEKVNRTIIKEKFIDLFKELVIEFISLDKDPIRLGELSFALHNYFKTYSISETLKSELLWEAYRGYIIRYTSDRKNNLEQPDTYGIVQSMGWIFRFLNVLGERIPEADVSHSVFAAFCGIPCVLAKLGSSTPFILTDHRFYLREQYPELYFLKDNSYLKNFLLRFYSSVSGLCYYYSDHIAAVNAYNTKWDNEFLASPKSIGVEALDINLYKLTSNQPLKEYVTIIAQMEIKPENSIKMMIKVADIIKKELHSFKFIIYGQIVDYDYYIECCSLVNELSLKKNFIFGGIGLDDSIVLKSGDIIIVTSEGNFPYSIVEVMLQGKPIIAPESEEFRMLLGTDGLYYMPNEELSFKNSLIKLIENSEYREELGRAIIDRVKSYYSFEEILDYYKETYDELKGNKSVDNEAKALYLSQKLELEKGFAMFQYEYYEEAIRSFRSALKMNMPHIAVVVVLYKIAEAYLKLGNSRMADFEMEKCRLIGV